MARYAVGDKKNVVVAGGAGFLGSHLCDELVKTSRVICIDNFSTGSEENIHHLLPNPDFKFLRHDVTQPFDLTLFPELRQFQVSFQGVQEVYNLACPASPAAYTANPIAALLASAYGTRNTLDVAVQNGAKYVFFSSSAVYGEPRDVRPVTEDVWGTVDPLGPRSSYAEGKRFAESLVAQYRTVHQVDAKILRVFNTYGPRMRLGDGRMVPDLIAAALHNQSIVVYGEQQEQTTLNYVSDLIEAVLKLTAGADPGPLNLGNPETHALCEVATLVQQLAGSPAAIEYQPRLAHMSRQNIPDITRAKERLGWFPVVPLAEGLQRTIEDMRARQVLSLENLTTGRSTSPS